MDGAAAARKKLVAGSERGGKIRVHWEDTRIWDLFGDTNRDRGASYRKEAMGFRDTF